MGTPRRPRPPRTNAMRNTSYSADAGADGDDDDFVAYAAAGAGGGFASETSFRIRGGRGGAEEVAELFRNLGLAGPEDFAIPPAVYAAATNATRRRASLEEESPRAGTDASSSSSSSSSPSEIPETSGRDVTAGAGGGFASETSFRIRGGRGRAEEDAELFRKLGLSGPEDFAIPPAVYAAATNATRRRASLEEESPRAGTEASSSSSSPSEIPETPF